MNRLVSLSLVVLGIFCIGCNSEKPLAHEAALRISAEEDPLTLDPRKTRDLGTATLIQTLYEGLMRTGQDGKPALALAENISISPDKKTYRFKIRPSKWSDGQPVTAQDFEESWKSILSPTFAAPNAYQLYIIKNGQAAKEGKVPLDQIGIRSEDPSTLVVELENPTPYFLELLTTHFYYPASPALRAATSPLPDKQIAFNGPFQLKSWEKKSELNVVPNPHYWDRQAVKLDRISMVLLDNPTALQLYDKHELDWAGSPLGTIPTDAVQALRASDKLDITPGAGVFLFRVNTKKAPFDQVKVRQAFALALDRQALVDYVLKGNQIPATGLIPPSFLKDQSLFKDHDVSKARSLLDEYLKENNLTIKEIPSITISYPNGERSHKIAQVAQQQWKEAFGIEVNLNSTESKVFFSLLKDNGYQMGIGSWFADFRDPISFLEIFKYKDNGTNNTQWENTRYIDLLNASSLAEGEQRNHLLQEAEKVIIEEMPVIPLFFSSYMHMQRPQVKGIYFSELGYLDFKHAQLDK